MPVAEKDDVQKAIDQLQSLPPDRQRAIVERLSPERKKDIMARLSGSPAAPKNVQAKVDEGTDKRSTLRKAWESANTGLISGDKLLDIVGSTIPRPADMKEGETPSQYIRRNASYINPNHHYLAALRSGLSGAVSDTYDTVASFTSPVSIALLATGALSKALPAGSKLAPAVRALLTGAGVGFGAQGAEQLGTGAGKISAEGPTPENTREALMGAGTALLGGAGAGEGVKPTLEAIPKKLQRGAQQILDIGPELTENAVTKATAKHAEAVKDVEAKRAAEAEKVETGNRAKIEKYEDAKREALRKEEEQKAEHTLATEEVKARNEAAQELQTRRGVLARDLKQGSAELGNGIAQLDKQVKSIADKKYDNVRAAVKEDPGVSPEDAVKAVKHARKNIIKGSEESIRQFTSILRREPAEDVTSVIEAARASSSPEAREFAKKYDAISEAAGGGELPPDAENIKFNDLQGYSSEIGKRLAKGNLEGDVYQALKYVKEKIDAQKAEIAERHHVGPMLEDADAFYRQYMETFYDKPSAVAATLDTVGELDPDFYAEPFIRGKAAQRGISSLRKFGKEFPLASEMADRAESLRTMQEEFKGLRNIPKVKELPNPPSPVELPKKPVLEAAKQIPDPEAPAIDPRQLKTEKLKAQAESLRGFRRYDAFILINSVVWSFLGGGWKTLLAEPAVLGGKIALGRALNRPAVVEWLTTPQPEDLAALKKLPKEARDEFNSNMRNFINEEKAHDRPVNVAPEVGKFLGINAKDLIDRGKEIIKGEEGSVTMPRPRANEQSGKTEVATGSVPRGTHTAEGAAFDTDVFAQVKKEHPDWPLRRQIHEATNRADTARGRGVTQNASGESPASMEAINRSKSLKSQGVKTVKIDTRSGQETPLYGVDEVDAKAGPYDVIVRRKADGSEEIMDQGNKARVNPPRRGGPETGEEEGRITQSNIPALRREVAMLEEKLEAQTESGDSQRWKTREKLLDAQKRLAEAEGK